MKFERYEDGQGVLCDDYGNTIQLSDDQIDAMSDMDGSERLDYIIENLRNPLRKANKEPSVKKQKRDAQVGKDPLEILDAWTNKKGMAKKLGKISFDEDEDDEEDEDEDDDMDEDDDDEDEDHEHDEHDEHGVF